MSFITKLWKNGPSGGTPLSAASLEDLEERVSAYVPESVVTTSGLEAGEEVHIFQVSPKRNLAVTLGKAAAPDEAFGSAVKVSRTLKVAESAFTGDGDDGLAALAGVTHAIAGSEAQGIGVMGGARTDGTYLGTNSHSDAIGGYFVGVSTAASTRSGQGIFASGRRENTAGVAVGNETVCDNETAEAGTYNKEGASSTRGIWLHPIGTADSGCGLQIGHTGTPHWAVGIGINKEAVTGQGFRDDSESETSIQINGSHSKGALIVSAAAGPVVIGNPEKNFSGSQLLEIYYGEEALDPGFVFGTGKGKSVSGILIRNSTGQMKVFAANASNAFLTGTAQGDAGLNFTAGKIFHIGAQGKTSLLRVNETGVGFNGVAPVARASAITSPAAELAPLKTAVDAIREAVKSIGITE